MRIRNWNRALTAAAAAALVFAGVGGAAAEGKRLIFATQEAGSSYHTLGTGFATMLTEKMGRSVTVQPYGGSTVYLPLVANGEAALGFISSIDGGAAYAERGLKDLRAVARIMPFSVAYMARADSGIKTIADMRGKRVVVDFKAMVSMGKVTRAMLAAGGLSTKDVKAITFGGIGEGNKALIEGNVDVTFIAVGIPLVKKAHSAIPGGVRYVDLVGPNATDAFLHGQTPGLYTWKIQPSSNLPEVAVPVTVTAFDTFLVTGKSTSDATVTAILTALKANFGQLQKDYARLKRGDASKFSAPTNSMPYHPAAIAFYKANGVWSAGNDAVEKGFK